MDHGRNQQQSAIALFSAIEASMIEVNEGVTGRDPTDAETQSPCSCKGACVRSCPCKAADDKCKHECGCNKYRCKNRQTSGNTVENRQTSCYTPGSCCDNTIERFVESLDGDKTKEVLKSILGQHPGIAASVIELSQPTSSMQYDTPNWCRCQRCRPMPTPREMICCGHRSCITMTPNCRLVCGTGEVLRTAIASRSYDFVCTPTYDNRSMRHAGYRQYVMWEYGRLGRGNRVVCPSCVVWMIRDKFPSGDGSYTGFRDSRGCNLILIKQGFQCILAVNFDDFAV
ncbi:P2X purinoceptor 7-like [Ptychodera flava]|uniref:P2X purinoceptor 7-like n=1 Tax=Ptychodera flava TaxID=63121 RepID=UPI003969F903